MTRLVPNRFLFDFAIPLRYRATMPRLDGRLRDWNDSFLLPDLSSVDGEAPFGEVWACWNESGIALACRVTGKRQAVRCDPKAFWKSDNLRICTDMRDTRTIRRASRHCQQFYLLPAGGGKNGRDPVAGSTTIHRAQQQAPVIAPGRIPIRAEVTGDGYALEAMLHADVLHGFDPGEHPRIGFYYMLEDAELGQQYLTVGDDLYWHIDPSTWATAMLER